MSELEEVEELLARVMGHDSEEDRFSEIEKIVESTLRSYNAPNLEYNGIDVLAEFAKAENINTNFVVDEIGKILNEGFLLRIEPIEALIKIGTDAAMGEIGCMHYRNIERRSFENNIDYDNAVYSRNKVLSQAIETLQTIGTDVAVKVIEEIGVSYESTLRPAILSLIKFPKMEDGNFSPAVVEAAIELVEKLMKPKKILKIIRNSNPEEMDVLEKEIVAIDSSGIFSGAKDSLQAVFEIAREFSEQEQKFLTATENAILRPQPQ